MQPASRWMTLVWKVSKKHKKTKEEKRNILNLRVLTPMPYLARLIIKKFLIDL